MQKKEKKIASTFFAVFSLGFIILLKLLVFAIMLLGDKVVVEKYFKF